MNIVELRDVTKIYLQGDVEIRAVDGVSLDIGKGEFLALAGPSGSGKTTLLNMIGGLDSMTSGKVRVDGVELSEQSGSELAKLRLNKVGFVFQAYNLIPVLSAIENVEYVMLLQGVEEAERRTRAGEILDRVGLKGMHHRRPAQLSGGQQQRVAVARAIVSQPALILADEPTANLDSQNAAELLDTMRKLNEEKGTTFVFSTHDSLVMEYARRLVRLRDGKVEG